VARQEAFTAGRITLMQGDITDLAVEAFVYYARPDLVLGSGFGTAIAVRGGPAVQTELRAAGHADVGDAIVTTAGNMKAKHIVHAVGPRFQEDDTERKLRATVLSALERADERGIRRIAFPAMGSGFYGVPLDLGGRVVLSTIAGYLQDRGAFDEVIVCLLDAREYKVYLAQLEKLNAPAAAGA
jgi:O-acetyl-ADP-ribose deacetylase (regulator of RNase III)